MQINYEEIRNDSKKITDSMMSSKQCVPSFFEPMRYVKYHILTYLIFALLSFFFPDASGDIMIGIAILGFGLLHWFFIFCFISGYVGLFAMVSSSDVKELKLSRIISKKVKSYGIAWLMIITLLGLVSVTTELNIGALVFGNFLFSIFGFFIFNLDISRYQVAGLFGALSAAKDKMNQ